MKKKQFSTNHVFRPTLEGHSLRYVMYTYYPTGEYRFVEDIGEQREIIVVVNISNIY